MERGRENVEWAERHGETKISEGNRRGDGMDPGAALYEGRWG